MEEEKNFLLLMIEKYRNIVENKETDGASLHQKRKAWLEIEFRLNAEPDHTKVSFLFTQFKLNNLINLLVT